MPGVRTPRVRMRVPWMGDRDDYDGNDCGDDRLMMVTVMVAKIMVITTMMKHDHHEYDCDDDGQNDGDDGFTLAKSWSSSKVTTTPTTLKGKTQQSTQRLL